MKSIIARTLMTLAAGLLLSACATTTHYPNVSVYGASLQVDRVSDHLLDGGALQVVVFGHSTAVYQQPIRYRALWADAQGRPIQTTVSAWKEMTLDPRRPFTMQFVGPGERGKAYRIEIEGKERN